MKARPHKAAQVFSFNLMKTSHLDQEHCSSIQGVCLLGNIFQLAGAPFLLGAGTLILYSKEPCSYRRKAPRGHPPIILHSIIKKSPGGII